MIGPWRERWVNQVCSVSAEGAVYYVTADPHAEVPVCHSVCIHAMWASRELWRADARMPPIRQQWVQWREPWWVKCGEERGDRESISIFKRKKCLILKKKKTLSNVYEGMQSGSFLCAATHGGWTGTLAWMGLHFKGRGILVLALVPQAWWTSRDGEIWAKRLTGRSAWIERLLECSRRHQLLKSVTVAYKRDPRCLFEFNFPPAQWHGI